MKLSEQLKQDNESGDFGKALEGYAERASAMEEILEAVAHIGVAFGCGEVSIQPNDPIVLRAREIVSE